ncbi:MAG: hypothetical protein ACP5IT_10670 [Thermoproteota archaeon]
MRFVHQVEELPSATLYKEKKLPLPVEARKRIKAFNFETANLLTSAESLCKTLDYLDRGLFQGSELKEVKTDLDTEIMAVDWFIDRTSAHLFGGKYPPLLEEAKKFLKEVEEHIKWKDYRSAWLACTDLRKTFYNFATTEFDSTGL